MSTTEKLSRVSCNSCGLHFNIGEAAVRYRKYGNVEIREKVCPVCGGTFRSIELPKEFDKYLYVNDDERYYSYGDKRRN